MLDHPIGRLASPLVSTMQDYVHTKNKGAILRWSRFLRQAAKVDFQTQRMIHREDTQTVYG